MRRKPAREPTSGTAAPSDVYRDFVKLLQGVDIKKITPHSKVLLDKLIVAEEFAKSETIFRASISIINVTVPHSWVLSRSAEPSFQLHYRLLKIHFNIILTYVLTSVM